MDKKTIKNVTFVILLIVQALMFNNSFHELTTLVENNSPYVDDGTGTYLDLEIGVYEQEQSAYLGAYNTLEIYTYKLFQTILLLFGIFMCLIFLAINNQDYSIIEQLGGKTE